MTSTRYNVEKVTRFGSALYLAHIPGINMEWTTEAEDAFEFDDIDDAQADADKFGGEVLSFGRPGADRFPTLTLIAAE